MGEVLNLANSVWVLKNEIGSPKMVGLVGFSGFPMNKPRKGYPQQNTEPNGYELCKHGPHGEPVNGMEVYVHSVPVDIATGATVKRQ